jgi:hypothetical protein
MLLLVMLAVTALAVGGGLVYARLNATHPSRRDDEARTQALWLARSALDAGVQGSREVDSAAGKATVKVQAAGAERWVEVDLGAVSVRVEAAPWREEVRTRRD